LFAGHESVPLRLVGVPQPYLPVPASGSERLAVGRKRNGADQLTVPFQNGLLLSRCDVPEDDGVIFTPRCQGRWFRGKSQGPDLLRVSFLGANPLSRTGIPPLHDTVVVTGRDSLAVGGNRERRSGAPVRGKVSVIR